MTQVAECQRLGRVLRSDVPVPGWLLEGADAETVLGVPKGCRGETPVGGRERGGRTGKSRQTMLWT